MPRLFEQTPPSYLKWARLFLSKSDNGSQLSPFPYIGSVTNRIVLCTKVIRHFLTKIIDIIEIHFIQLLATYLYPGTPNAHWHYLCNIAANNNGNSFKNSFVIYHSILDGTSPAPTLFTPINSTSNDGSSRYQQIIDTFLSDGMTRLSFNKLLTLFIVQRQLNSIVYHCVFTLYFMKRSVMQRFIQNLIYHDELMNLSVEKNCPIMIQSFSIKIFIRVSSHYVVQN